jgi:integrase
MLKRRRLAIGPGVEPVFPDSLGGWRDPSNVRKVWRQVRDELEMEGLVTHHLRKTVATFLDDSHVPARKISDQLGHSKVSMTQDRYLRRRLTDRLTAEVLGKATPRRRRGSQKYPWILTSRKPQAPELG